MTAVLTALALVAVGVCVGVVAGLLGVGGGILIVPFLVLAMGSTQQAAEATSLLVILPTAIVASIANRRRGVGDLSLALRFGAVGSVGALGGALLALSLPSHALQRVFAVFLGVIGLRMLRDALRAPGR